MSIFGALSLMAGMPFAMSSFHHPLSSFSHSFFGPRSILSSVFDDFVPLTLGTRYAPDILDLFFEPPPYLYWAPTKRATVVPTGELTIDSPYGDMKISYRPATPPLDRSTSASQSGFIATRRSYGTSHALDSDLQMLRDRLPLGGFQDIYSAKIPVEKNALFLSARKTVGELTAASRRYVSLSEHLSEEGRHELELLTAADQDARDTEPDSDKLTYRRVVHNHLASTKQMGSLPEWNDDMDPHGQVMAYALKLGGLSGGCLLSDLTDMTQVNAGSEDEDEQAKEARMQRAKLATSLLAELTKTIKSAIAQDFPAWPKAEMSDMDVATDAAGPAASAVATAEDPVAPAVPAHKQDVASDTSSTKKVGLFGDADAPGW